jgi:glycosyltransferase involved in cell wall biosynthesis
MTIAEPLVSFVVINFNYGDFVGAAIESVLQQDYQRYECVIVDNNSQDNSREIMRMFDGCDARLRFLYLDQNLNQIGALLHVLNDLKGEYLTIVDSDDLLFRNYASMHVRAHLNIPGGVAFTSSCVIEIDARGCSLTSGYHTFLARNRGVQLSRLVSSEAPSLADEAPMEGLLNSVWVVAPEVQGWHWSPGTANMHNLALVRATRPRLQEGVYVGATDNYFMWLNHAIGGSARIDVPLSAYRNHGRNRYGATVSIGDLQNGTRAAVNRSAVRRRDITRELVSRPLEFDRLAPGHFWRLMDAPAAVLTRGIGDYFGNRHVLKILEEHFDDMVGAFGEADVRRQLVARIGMWSYLRLKRRARSRSVRPARMA